MSSLPFQFIVYAQLTRLGCLPLPKRMLQEINEEFDSLARRELERLASREITGAKVSRLVRRAIETRQISSGGSKGDEARIPLGQPDSLISGFRDETRPVAGTTEEDRP